MISISFSMKIDKMEIRSCNKNLLQENEHTTAEIIYWEKDKDNKEYCYVLAYYVISKDYDIDLKFVGNRPFANEIDWNNFYKLAKYGQETLNNFYMVQN